MPDQRGHLETEQRLGASAAIDALSIEQAMGVINTQDMSVPLAVRNAVPALSRLAQRVVEGMKHGGRLVYVGAGTSGRLGVLDASECPPTFFADPGQVVGVIAGGDQALRHSVEGVEDDPDSGAAEMTRLEIAEHDTVVGIAGGGTTAYVWGALGEAKSRLASVGLICCVPMKSLMHRPRAKVVPANQTAPAPERPRLPVDLDFPVELLVGAEVITGSTRMKAGSATKMALNLLSTTAMIQLGKVWSNLMVDLRASNAKLRDRALRILTDQTDHERESAQGLLDQADGQVKLALVMARLNLDADQARERLNQTQGHLRPLIGSPR